MPTGANARRRDLTEEDHLAQLQQAVQQQQSGAAANNADSQEAGGGNDGDGATPTDGARNPLAAGADYASLRLITRRQPQDPEAVLDGLDTTNADLSWTAQEGPVGLDPKGRPWLYPKKRGKGEGSNLDQFKDEITERTSNGQGCKAIAEALVEKGVDTSVRAVARQRMKWGLRQRAVRRMTEQGIANIRKAHLEQAKRLANSDPVPVKRVRIRVMRKAEITRMTKEGMSAAQIADNLTARGVKLKRGAATVERLRTVWGLLGHTQRSINNVRANARNHAVRAQKDQFQNIARELGIADADEWVRAKMDEEVALEARREYAYKLMGDVRPKPVDPVTLRRNAAHLRSLAADKRKAAGGNVLNQIPGVDFIPETFDPVFSPGQQDPTPALGQGSPSASAGEGASLEIVDVSSDEDETEDEKMGDEGAAGGPSGADKQDTPQAQAQAEAPGSTAMSLDVNAPPYLQSRFEPTSSSVQQHGSPPLESYEPYGYGSSRLQPAGGPDQASATPAACNGPPAPPSTSPFVNIAPRPLPSQPKGPRAIAPRPLAPMPAPLHPQKPKIDYMAQFGLFPYPTQGKARQKYLTPTGRLITTDGYEYLAGPPEPPCSVPLPPPAQAQPGVIRVMSSAQPDYIVVPPPPPPKMSQIPAPPLIMPPEEVEKHKDDYKTIEEHHKITQECMDLLVARANCRPLADSLTGMPPSLKDIHTAKEKLREAATALLAGL